MKKIILLVALLTFVLSSSLVLAHSGGTDRNGGHYDHKTGIYHYHNKGYVDND